jgi:hypothetical protein
MRALVLVHILLSIGASACQRSADAQNGRDSLAPVRCYQIADGRQLASQSALQLCAGTPTTAPGLCFAESSDRFRDLATQQMLQLCTRATSLQPVDCYAQVSARGDVTSDQAVRFCATICPIGPAPPEGSSAACLDAATRRTTLSLQSAAQLCIGSSSDGPVDCFLAGRELHTLTDSSLVQLCPESTGCQYYNAAPASY